MSLPWYGTAQNASTCAVANGGTTVTVTGANLVTDGGNDPGFVGQGWIGPDGKTYEITAVPTTTTLTIRFPGAATGYQGTTVVSGGNYAICPFQGFMRDAAFKLSQLANQPLSYSSVLANAKAAVLAGVVLANGFAMAVGGNNTIGDGYGGTFTYDSTDTTTTFSQDGLGFVDNQGRRFKRLYHPYLFDVRWFKAQLNGSDDTAPLNAALAAVNASGGALLISGALSVDSTPTVGFTLSNKVKIYGYNRLVSKIIVTGSADLYPLLTAADPRDVWIEDLTLVGNNVSTHGATASAIWFWGTTGCSSEMRNYGVRRIHVENFKGDNKVYIRNDSNYSMKDGTFDRLEVKTFSGNDRNSANIAVASTGLSFRGQCFFVGGLIEGITIIDYIGDGDWIKRGIDFFSGVKDVKIRGGVLKNFGANTTANSGAYSINIYNDDSGGLGGSAVPPQSILIDGMRIINPFSCGVYSADGKDLTVVNCDISGQTDTQDNRAGGYLPKGAIALAGVFGHILVANNKLSDNYVNVYVQGHAGASIVVDSNPTRGAVASASGIIVYPTADSDATTTVLVKNSLVELTGTTTTALLVVSANTVNPGVIKVTGGKLSGTLYAMRGFDTVSTLGVKCTSLTIGGGLLLTAPNGGNTLNGVGLSCPGTATPLLIDGVDVACAGFTSVSTGVDINAATNVNIKSLTIRDKIASTTAFNCENANGNMPPGSIRLYNCAVPYASTTFGIALPTWGGQRGDMVTNLNEVEAGSGGSKYVLTGWIFTTVWLPMRPPTGN